LITSETFDLIEENRKETEDVTITLSDYLDVYIVSKQTLKQASFQKFTKTYILK
jgi:PHD/YefM family antitoxin component YafN of YafNO toxin-antitoxin module